jgi:hypothetical protein
MKEVSLNFYRYRLRRAYFFILGVEDFDTNALAIQFKQQPYVFRSDIKCTSLSAG